jgi:CheY-like chemotaxis protein
MLLGNRILVVDDSRFMLEALGQILQPHFSTILFASSYREVAAQLQQNPDTDVIICDVILPDGSGFQLLEKVASGPDPKPRVLLITGRFSEADSKRAISLGAIGYLKKPILIGDVRAHLKAVQVPECRAPRHRTLARAWLIDPESRERLLAFDIHDLSATGAKLDTAGPFLIGSKLEFEIAFGDESDVVRVKATVVRADEPSWLSTGGTAVHFDWVESPEELKKLAGTDHAVATHV